MRGAVERKYALAKVAAGDYLLPSNDAATVWRIAKYTEGPSSGIVGWSRDKEVWGLWKWHRPMSPGNAVDTADWSGWEFWDGPLFSRQEAIDSALSPPPIKGSEVGG